MKTPDNTASRTERAVQERHAKPYRNLNTATGGTWLENDQLSCTSRYNWSELPQQKTVLRREVITRYGNGWQNFRRHCLDVQPNFHDISLVNHRVLREQRTSFVETCLILPQNSQYYRDCSCGIKLWLECLFFTPWHWKLLTSIVSSFVYK